MTGIAGSKALVGLALPAMTFAGPFTPASTVSTLQVMMGLGVTFTPKATGKVLVRVGFMVGNQTASVSNAVSGQYGTGAPPANGAALTVTVFPQGVMTYKPATATQNLENYGEAIGTLVGLVVGTTYWVDLALATGAGADAAQVGNVMVTIQETN